MEPAIDLLAGRCEAYELLSQRSETTAVSLEAGALKEATVRESSGWGCRVVVAGRAGLSSTNQLERLGDMVDAAVASAAFGQALPFGFPGPADGPQVGGFDEGLAGLSIDALIDRGRGLVDALREICPDARQDVHLSRGLTEFEFLNSSGQRFRTRHTGCSASLSLERFAADDILSIYDWDSATGDTIDTDALVAGIRRRFADAQRVVPVESGPMPVLFAPRAVYTLLLPVEVALSGKNVAQGVSALADRLGEQVFSEKLTAVDDATLPDRPASTSHDDEGVPTRPLTLVDGGVVQAFYTDLHSASRLGTTSTGHANRGLGSAPAPGSSNVLIRPGQVPLEQMIAGIDCGLLVDHVLGVGQGNPLSGDFSNTLDLAFKIEKGHVVGRVKNTSIGGNVYEDLQHIAALEDRAHWVHGMLCCPHILLERLSVTSKS
jgi:PmbA protein